MIASKTGDSAIIPASEAERKRSVQFADSALARSEIIALIGLVCLEAEHDEILGSDLRDTTKLERLGRSGLDERLSIHSLLGDEDNGRVISFPNLERCHR
ncbi:hypothetical protein [Bradyrhizobium cajani]|uniref:Uncharacterized protein n=1 Tax=Bradyrhizobium cajani TaxID=1928661 RepID=A0A844TFW0_9BRAD|nr:hypothetical protein [Bradyrhizobium cajani]MCP3368720.1 hypothetical protein [Bradyrhizobium cajani]MVT73500.1 hypothetical protein [Bradyrhizobium cajani]